MVNVRRPVGLAERRLGLSSTETSIPERGRFWHVILVPPPDSRKRDCHERRLLVHDIQRNVSLLRYGFPSRRVIRPFCSKTIYAIVINNSGEIKKESKSAHGTHSLMHYPESVSKLKGPHADAAIPATASSVLMARLIPRGGLSGSIPFHGESVGPAGSI